MSDQFVGEIRLFGCNFAPKGWAFCQGQLLPLSQNTALFSLLGTNYGGNGTNTFGLPNLQGNMAIHQGTGAGLSTYFVGETGGSASVTLLTSNLPAHSHTLPASTSVGRVNIPTSTSGLGAVGRGAPDPYAGAPPNALMAAAGLTSVGSNVPHNNMMPSMALNYCIALVGIYPTRN